MSIFMVELKCQNGLLSFIKLLTNLFVGQLRLGRVNDAPVAIEGDDDDGKGCKVDGEAGSSLVSQDKG